MTVKRGQGHRGMGERDSFLYAESGRLLWDERGLEREAGLQV